MSLKNKESQALELIKKALSEHEKPFLSCSFGKDSLVVMHLVHRINKEIPIVWARTGVNHPTVYKVVDHYKKLGYKIIEANPDYSFWEIVNKYGWPIGARNTGSNTAVTQCCKELKKKPMARKTENFDLEFNGLTAFESWTRYCRLKADGLYKFVKSRGKKGRYVCMPIGFWHTNDVWDYIQKYNILYPDVYNEELEDLTKRGYRKKVKGIEMDRGMIRLGCWVCPLKIKYSDKVMKQLREYHPKLWETLMEKGLAKEVAEIKLKGQGSLIDGYFTEETIQYWIEKRPCFFDKI